jgi:hypothetical protein
MCEALLHVRLGGEVEGQAAADAAAATRQG